MLRAIQHSASSCLRSTPLPSATFCFPKQLQTAHTAASLQFFRDTLGPSGVITDPSVLLPHNTDWMNKYQGRSTLLLRPKTTTEVAAVLQHCSRHGLAVVPQGGNTGLVGGSVPLQDEVIVNLSRMNRILGFAEGGALACEAGCILEQLDAHAAEHGYMMPLDLGAKGSCQIGGNLSTNAGGLRLLRYGSLRGSVLGVEAVLADGTVIDSMKMLRKDNTGFDLKQLFIGSEGTLGVITKVAIQCAPKPSAVHTMLLAVPNFEAIPHVHKLATAHLAEILSAFEFLDGASMQLALTHLPDTSNPFEQEHSMYILVETSGSGEDHDASKLERFMEACMAADSVSDAVVAYDSDQIANIWRIREGISESLQKHGSVYKYDLSVPMTKMYELVEDVRGRVQELGDDVITAGYGHVGDGNLHLNVSDAQRRPSQEMLPHLEPFVYEWTKGQNGSISAEHGMGVLKNEYMQYSQPPEAIALMRRIKALFDPHNILNPGKVLPQRS